MNTENGIAGDEFLSVALFLKVVGRRLSRGLVDSRDLAYAVPEGFHLVVSVFLVCLALGVAGHLHADLLGDVSLGEP